MAAASSSSSTVLSRSVYVAQLRRAFLLRAHPDRFRNLDDHVRKGQATLLQALSERWDQQDFQDYTANVASSHGNQQAQRRMMMAVSSNHNPRTNKKQSPIPFVLEKRDGSLLQQTIQLEDSVEAILKNMAKALEMTGAASLPGPPPPPPSQVEEPRNRGTASSVMWAKGVTSTQTQFANYDINSQKGRDLMKFLQTTPASEVQQRRAFRMDASAAALVARRLYSFQAIDGISMGWSSESFAVLLRSLISLHERHSSKFHVQSFYPLRLVYAHDEFHSALDVYGGNLYLHPAATQLQMLGNLQQVTESKLEEFHQNRALMEQRTILLQNEVGVKLTKGFSCSSREYHKFLEQVVQCTSFEEQDGPVDQGITTTSTSLDIGRVRMVVESPGACRRPRLTKEGFIQVHALMTLNQIKNAKSRLSEGALQRREEQKQQEQRSKEAIEEVQWAVGVEKVSRGRLVSHSDFVLSLSRLIDQSSEFREPMAGYSLSIIGQGQFCHLGDDGSLIVPHDWR